jgi:hypothetical protein
MDKNMDKTFKFKVDVIVNKDTWKDFFDTETEFVNFLKKKLSTTEIKELSFVKSVEVKKDG